MLALLLAALAPAPGAAVQNPEIVVIGQRIRQAGDALKDCLARNCPPDQDIDATLALAETQILGGEYRAARKTLLQSLARNKRQAKAYPIPVSDLYRANGRVAANLGLDRDYQHSTWEIYRTLKQGPAEDQARRFTALMEVATMVGRLRGHTRARLYYEWIGREARAAGRPDIASMADLRSAMQHLPRWMAKDRIRKIADSPDPELRAAALESKLALARLAYEENDAATAAALQAELAALDIKRPILIYQPPFQLASMEIVSDSEFGISQDNAPGNNGLGNPGSNGPAGRGSTTTSALPVAMMSSTKRISPSFEDMWIDVGFHITPAGTVSGLEVVRSRGDRSWTRPLLASIRGRKYTAGKPGDPASKRLERYTLTAGYEAKSESHMQDRSPQGRIEFIDLGTDGLSTPQ